MPLQLVGISQGSTSRVRLHVADLLFKYYGLGRKLEDLLNEILHGTDWLQRIFGDYDTFKAQVIIQRANKIRFMTSDCQTPNDIRTMYLKCLSRQGGSNNSPSKTVHHLWICTSLDTTTNTFQGRTLCEPIVYCAWILPCLKYD